MRRVGLQRDVGEQLGEAERGVVHERGVERAADVERRRAADAELLGARRSRRRRPSGVPAMTTCPGALSFATQHASGAAVHASAACSGVAPSSAAMRPGVGVGGGLGELGPTGREAHAVGERERAGRDERGDLAEGVARRTRPGARTWRADRLPRDERRREHRELGLARPGEHLGGRVEQELGERLAGGGLGLDDDLPRVVVAPGRAEARGLRALSGEDDCDGH